MEGAPNLNPVEAQMEQDQESAAAESMELEANIRKLEADESVPPAVRNRIAGALRNYQSRGILKGFGYDVSSNPELTRLVKRDDGQGGRTVWKTYANLDGLNTPIDVFEDGELAHPLAME